MVLVWYPLTQATQAAIIIFYLWTSLATLLLTAVFWIVTTDYFVLREAKRLFGFITAGGTLGAMAAGLSV